MNMDDQVKFTLAHPNKNVGQSSQCSIDKKITTFVFGVRSRIVYLQLLFEMSVTEREREQILQLSLPTFSDPLSPVSTR